MVDTDTFPTVLYVMADAFCKCQSRPEVSPGLRACLTGSEVVYPGHLQSVGTLPK